MPIHNVYWITVVYLGPLSYSCSCCSARPKPRAPDDDKVAAAMAYLPTLTCWPCKAETKCYVIFSGD